MQAKSLPFLLAVAILVTACGSPGALAAEWTPEIDSIDTSPKIDVPTDCQVTRSPKTPFVPPKPWPEHPPTKDSFWVGETGLWTALPNNGIWRQLALGEKFWWWSQEFDVSEDETPDLTLSARRQEGKAQDYQVSGATNGYHPSFHWAMLTGVDLPGPGCWEITGKYKDHKLTITVWVPPE